MATRGEWARRSGRSSRWIRPSSRLAIYLRDSFRCVLCGKCTMPAERTLDHVVPRRMGGSNRPDNLVLACLRCNSSRQDGEIPEAAMERVRAALAEPVCAVLRAEARRLLKDKA